MELWQRLMDNWSKLTFREHHRRFTPKVRVLRVLEEAMELAQASGVTSEEATTVRDQVWSKVPGDPKQELGGVLVCLAGYAATSDLDMQESFMDEYMRICDPTIMQKVYNRNIGGDKIGIEVDPTIPKQSFTILGRIEGERLTLHTNPEGTPHLKRTVADTHLSIISDSSVYFESNDHRYVGSLPRQPPES